MACLVKKVIRASGPVSVDICKSPVVASPRDFVVARRPSYLKGQSGTSQSNRQGHKNRNHNREYRENYKQHYEQSPPLFQQLHKSQPQQNADEKQDQQDESFKNQAERFGVLPNPQLQVHENIMHQSQHHLFSGQIFKQMQTAQQSESQPLCSAFEEITAIELNATREIERPVQYESVGCLEDEQGRESCMSAASSCSASRLLNDFVLVKELGHGGFGCVYQVKNKLDRAHYAIKVVIFGPTDETSPYSEAQTLACLNHPNIVRYHAAWIEPLTAELYGALQKGEDVSSVCPSASRSDSPSLQLHSSSYNSQSQGLSGPSLELRIATSPLRHQGTESPLSELDVSLESAALASCARCAPSSAGGEQKALMIQMELLSTSTLREWLAQARQPLWYPALMHIFRQVLHSLQYLHGLFIIHRDLKPANILFERGEVDGLPNVKLGDFGLSLQVKEAQPSNNSAAGTALYASPEQVSGLHCDNRSDLYSVGIMLVEALCAPFTTASERVSVLTSARQGILPPSVREQHPELTTAILLLLSRDRANRPSARELLETFWRPISIPLTRAVLPPPLQAAWPRVDGPPSHAHRQGLRLHSSTCSGISGPDRRRRREILEREILALQSELQQLTC